MDSFDTSVHTLACGLRLTVEPLGGESVAFNFRFTAGAKDDPEELRGLAHVTAQTLFRGTRTKDAREILDALDCYGVRWSAGAGSATTDIGGLCLARDLGAVLPLYTEMLREAAFRDDQVEVAKTLALGELAHLDDQPIAKVGLLIWEAALDEPLGRMALGRAETIPRVTSESVRAYWRRACQPRACELAIAGGVEEADALAAVDAAFGNWSGDGDGPTTPRATLRAGGHHQPKASEQAHIALVYGSTEPTGSDYYAARLAIDGILSGGGSSRLFTEVREKRGLVYSVGSSYRALRDLGAVFVYAGTTAARAQETMDVCLDEIRRLAQTITEEELERGKNILLGRLLTTGELAEHRVGSIAEDLYLRGRVRPVDEVAGAIRAVTLDEVRAHLAAYPPEPLTTLVLGPSPLEVRT